MKKFALFACIFVLAVFCAAPVFAADYPGWASFVDAPEQVLTIDGSIWSAADASELIAEIDDLLLALDGDGINDGNPLDGVVAINIGNEESWTLLSLVLKELITVGAMLIDDHTDVHVTANGFPSEMIGEMNTNTGWDGAFGLGTWENTWFMFASAFKLFDIHLTLTLDDVYGGAADEPEPNLQGASWFIKYLMELPFTFKFKEIILDGGSYLEIDGADVDTFPPSATKVTVLNGKVKNVGGDPIIIYGPDGKPILVDSGDEFDNIPPTPKPKPEPEPKKKSSRWGCDASGGLFGLIALAGLMIARRKFSR